jgi:hypothetical protein
MSGLTALLGADLALNITPVGFGLILAATILCGLLFSALYIFTHRDDLVPNGLPLTLVVVPIAAAIVILLVGRNIATALGLGGIFVLVRFRSGPVETRDLAYLFSAICNGVLSGCGYVGYSVVFTLVMCALILALEVAGWGKNSGDAMLLKIWVPENLDFQGVFEPVLEKYTRSSKLLMVRTTDFGSLCELRYKLTPKADMNQKELLDKIRSRNGNMNVVLVVAPSIVERRSKQVL